MPNAKDLIERARMFDQRAEQARDPISRQHYREMAAHYRSLSVEHQEATSPQRSERQRSCPPSGTFFKQVARGATLVGHNHLHLLRVGNRPWSPINGRIGDIYR